MQQEKEIFVAQILQDSLLKGKTCKEQILVKLIFAVLTFLRQTLLDLYHNQPIDPSLAAISFQDLKQNNPQAELELVSVARTGKNGDKLHLKAATSPKADLSALNAEYFTNIEYLKSLSPEAQEALLIERGATINRFLEHRFSIQNPVHIWDYGSSQKPRFRCLNIQKSSFWYY